MKNILLKSSEVFVIMTFLNFIFSVLILFLTDLPGGDFGMYPFLILIECLIVSVISFITIVIFKSSYNSIFKIALLFEIIYLFSLIIFGFNPFGNEDSNIFSLLIYLNSCVIFFIIYFFNLCYSKLISLKSRK